jgi:hypothetical protein
MEKESTRSVAQNSEPASWSVSKIAKILFAIAPRDFPTQVASGILYSIQATVRIAFMLVVM